MSDPAPRDGDSLREPVTRILRGLAAQPAGVLLLFLALGTLCYYPSLSDSFIWDDHLLVRNNPAIRSPALIGEIFRHYLVFDSASTFYRPVQNLSFLLDYWVWELDPYGYRLTSLLLHVVNAFLLFLLLRRLWVKFIPTAEHEVGGGDSASVPVATCGALAVAVFWLVHPIHSAVVAYISGRADSLAMGFALLAWWCYERGSDFTGRRRGVSVAGWFVAAFLSLLLALCSKEIASIWIALFGVSLLLRRGDTTVRQRALAFAGCLLALGLYAGLRQIPVLPPGAYIPPAPPLPSRPVLMARSLGDYVSLLLFPADLHMERQVFFAPWQTHHTGEQIRFHLLFALGLAAVALLIIGARWQARGRELRVFGAVWFGLAWLPVSNLWRLNASVAEHWLYTPSIGFLLFLAGCLLAIPATALRSQGRPVAYAALACALPLLIMRTQFRSADWVDDLTFYQQTIQAGCDSPRMQLQLAQAVLRRGETPEAESMFRRLAAKYPTYGHARLGLAGALLQEGKHAEAASLLHTLRDSTAPADRALFPSVWAVSVRLPGETSDPEATLQRINDALAQQPAAWDLLEIRTRLLCQLHRTTEAEASVAAFHDARPWHYPATLLLAGLAEERGDLSRAEALYVAAGRLDMHEVTSRRARAMLRLREHQPEAARGLAQEAIDRQPGQAQNYLVLAQACTQLGRPQEAADAAARARLLQRAALP